MKNKLRHSLLYIALALPVSVGAVDETTDAEAEALKLAAIEALIAAPPERAVPILNGVLEGEGSDEMKRRALFVLAQTGTPEVEQLLRDYVQNAEGELQREAVRMIGIHGGESLVNGLMPIYESGDADLRGAVLEAYLIADRPAAVLQIAKNSQSDEEFEAAVRMLGAMGATSMLAELKDHDKASAGLIQAFAIAGDSESLLAMALDGSDKTRQLQAIQGLGIAGGDQVGARLMEIYQNTDDTEIREAVLQGLLISGEDAALLSLFKSSTDTKEKTVLLRYLVNTDSDAALEVINAALAEGR